MSCMALTQLQELVLLVLLVLELNQHKNLSLHKYLYLYLKLHTIFFVGLKGEIGKVDGFM